MHSTPMIVESMSAISSRLRRPSAGTRFASQPGAAKPTGRGPRSSTSTAVSASRRAVPSPAAAASGTPAAAVRTRTWGPTSDGGAARLQAQVEHLGDQERELERLGGVEPRVAGGVVAVGQVLVADRPHPAGALGDVLARHFEMHPA